MSLVRAPRSRQRLAGVLLLLLLGGGVTAVLALSGRTLGPGVRFTVELRRTGALRPNARIKLAGRDVGEVRGMVYRRQPAGTPSEGERRVVLDCFVARPWDAELRVNSELFVATPSILGESWLEIAPARGAPPGPPIAAGAQLRGSDPPELDEFIGRVYRAFRGIEELLHEHRPALDRLVLAGAGLASTLDDVGLGDAHVATLRARVRAAVDDARAVSEALREAAVPAHATSTDRAVTALAREAGPKLRALGAEAERIAATLDGVGDFVPADKQRQVREAVATLRQVAKAGEAMAATVAELEALVERGDGTVGGLMHDQELFDDLHETHRILKNQGWKLIAKPRAPEKGTAP